MVADSWKPEIGATSHEIGATSHSSMEQVELAGIVGKTVTAGFTVILPRRSPSSRRDDPRIAPGETRGNCAHFNPRPGGERRSISKLSPKTRSYVRNEGDQSKKRARED